MALLPSLPQAALKQTTQHTAPPHPTYCMQTALLCKQQAVEQIVDCLTAVQHIATQYNNSPDGGDSGQLLQLQQKLQFCLAQVGDTGQCATVKPHALDYLRVVWNPAWAAAVSDTALQPPATCLLLPAVSPHCDRPITLQPTVLQVRAMSDEEVLQRVRQAMGKCALMVLQGQGAAAWEQQQPAVSGCSTDPFQPQPQPQPADQQCQPQQCQEAAQGVVRFSGHPVINQGLNAGQQGPPMSAHLGSRPQHTAGGAVGPSSSTVLQDSSAGAAGNSCSVCSGSIAGGFGRGPAFEVCVVWDSLVGEWAGELCAWAFQPYGVSAAVSQHSLCPAILLCLSFAQQQPLTAVCVHASAPPPGVCNLGCAVQQG